MTTSAVSSFMPMWPRSHLASELWWRRDLAVIAFLLDASIKTVTHDAVRWSSCQMHHFLGQTVTITGTNLHNINVLFRSELRICHVSSFCAHAGCRRGEAAVHSGPFITGRLQGEECVYKAAHDTPGDAAGRGQPHSAAFTHTFHSQMLWFKTWSMWCLKKFLCIKAEIVEIFWMIFGHRFLADTDFSSIIIVTIIVKNRIFFLHFLH